MYQSKLQLTLSIDDQATLKLYLLSVDQSTIEKTIIYMKFDDFWAADWTVQATWNLRYWVISLDVIIAIIQTQIWNIYLA